MSNLAHGRVILKFSNSLLMQKSSPSLYIKFILNLYIFYELNSWPRNPTNNFSLTNFLFGKIFYFYFIFYFLFGIDFTKAKAKFS